MDKLLEKVEGLFTLRANGKSGYIVQLPSEWIKKEGLKAGDKIIILNNDGNLILQPQKRSSPS